MQSATLRIAAVDFEVGVDTGEPAIETVDDARADVLADATEGSQRSITVRGVPGQAFSFRGAVEPTPWPGVVWSEGSTLFWIYGEGLAEDAVLQVAESLRQVSKGDYRDTVNDEECPFG